MPVLPAIDPSGQKLFLWPNEPPPPSAAACRVSRRRRRYRCGPPPACRQLRAPSPLPGHRSAAAVVSTSCQRCTRRLFGPPVQRRLWPLPCPGSCRRSALRRCVPTSVVAPPIGAVPIGQDHVRITPDRVMAPVGSEVVLKAGICGADGYLHTDRRVEWLLSRDGAGQFVDLGDRGDVDVFRWPWDTPRKVDNWYAIGSTAYAPHVPESRDARSPRRRANRSRRGVDHRHLGDRRNQPRDGLRAGRRQLAISPGRPPRSTGSTRSGRFPPSAVAEPGRPQTLTTTVMRRTDGAPLAGWTVRYDVSGAAARWVTRAEIPSNVPTDATGRASVEVSPTNTGGGTSTIDVTIIRPATVGAETSPQLEVGRGVATITWGAGASGPTPAGALSLQPTPIIPKQSAFLVSATAAQLGRNGSLSCAASEPAARPPQLEVRMTNAGPQTVAVGGLVSFDVTVTNRGESTAQRVVVNDRFSEGLWHEKDTGEHSINYTGIPDLRPGDSKTIALTFRVDRAGQLCHEVTVTADNAAATAPQRACITGRDVSLSVSASRAGAAICGRDG